MQNDYQACEDRVLIHEGSEYTDGVHPYDPGGPTRWGITIYDARAHWKRDATADDVRTMPKSVAQKIYKDKYWDALNGDSLPAGVDDAIFDYGVNSGISRAGKVLRRVVGLPDQDWHVTNDVIHACSQRDSTAIINAICDERIKFLEGLAIWPTYGRGWSTRVREVRQYSTQLAGHEATPVSTPAPELPPTPTEPRAKGHHKPPVPTGPIIATGAGTAAGTGGFLHSLTGNPAIFVATLAVGVLVIAVLLVLLSRWQSAKQDAPVPGIVPVPVKVKP